MLRTFLLLAGLAPGLLLAQPLRINGHRGGLISLGIRTTMSAFNEGAWANSGSGIGGQLRVGLSDRVNTDWFMDYLTGNMGDLAHREDLHIGWSVLYYVLPGREGRPRVDPYVLAGHCFDHAAITANEDPDIHGERWSSAVQAGIGSHFHVTDRSDLSLVGQYMIHLGTDLHLDTHDDGDLELHNEHGASLEGHLLVHVSFNYILFDAW